jgi:hypothetical protein
MRGAALADTTAPDAEIGHRDTVIRGSIQANVGRLERVVHRVVTRRAGDTPATYK